MERRAEQDAGGTGREDVAQTHVLGGGALKESGRVGANGGGGKGGGDGGGKGGYPESVSRLIDELGRLPGIGSRSAERLAFHLLKGTAEDAQRLARAIEEMKRSVRHCPVCYTLTDQAGVCGVCADERRDARVVMVVEQPRDLIALEQTGMYKGVYHVLMGRISPLDGVGPGDVTIAELLARVDDPGCNSRGVAVEEVILAMNPTLEGDGTALYLAQQLSRRKVHGGNRAVRVTKLARGVPSGSQLEYASKAVLADAIEGRVVMG